MIGLVSTIRASLDEILTFTRHHHALGVDRIFLYLDAVEPSTLSALEDEPGIELQDCDSAHWQALGLGAAPSLEEKIIANANLALARARELGCDWLIHIDGDELLLPDGDIQEIFGSVASEVHSVRFALLEAVPDSIDIDDAFAMTTFRVPSRQGLLLLARLLGCRRAFFEGEFIRGHSRSKRAIRCTAPIAELGIHDSEASPGEEIVRIDHPQLRLLHFDFQGFESWKRKWRLRTSGETRAERMRPNRRRQFQVIAEAEEAADEVTLHALCERMQLIPSYERRVLRSLGMLVEVSLDERSRPRRRGAPIA